MRGFDHVEPTTSSGRFFRALDGVDTTTVLPLTLLLLRTAAETRSAVINVLGNLTLVTGELNSAMSNAPWVTKRQRLEKSILLLNSPIEAIADWDEQAIIERGDSLVDLILKRWPGPSAMIPGFDPSAVKPVIAEVNADQAELTPEQLITVLDETFELMRSLLVDLAAKPGERRRFVEIEDALGWSRGRLAAVLGGFAVFSKAKVEGRRPYRIGKDEDGGCWMWMDDGRAEAIRAHLALHA